MKTHAQKLFLLPGLMALGLMFAGRMAAQTYTNVHVFQGSPGDGANPQTTLIQSGNTLYGTTTVGGSNNSGTVFKVNTDGSSYTNFYNFTGVSGPFAPHTNSDGSQPAAGLVLSGNTLFGTTYVGGAWGDGTVFRVNIDGSAFTNLYTFTNGNDGSFPAGALVLSGNTLYGTGTSGGSQGGGVVFSIHTDGSGFTNLYSFTADLDGAIPQAGLVLSDSGVLYGTTTSGGNAGSGSVFAIRTNGLGFTNLYDFTATDFDTGTNLDGANSQAPLLLSGNTLYGTTTAGGPGDNGTVFRVSTNGLNFTNLYSFSASGGGPNNDGATPEAGLLLLGTNLYGTASLGGTSGNGSIFAVDTGGNHFTNLFNFALDINGEGAVPEGGLILVGRSLYGAAYTDAIGNGDIYGLTVTLPASPQLTLVLSGNNVILTWPTAAAGFTLQSATNLTPTVTWTTVNGQFAVTNQLSGLQKYYRLKY